MQKQKRSTPRQINGTSVYFEEHRSVLADFDNTISKLSIVQCATPADAHVFCVKDLIDPPKACKWHAVLCGGIVCKWDFVRSTAGSASIAYLPALKQRRLIYMTDAFIGIYPNISEIILQRATSYGSCNWKITNNEAYFRERAAKIPQQAIALVSSTEQIAEDAHAADPL